MITNFILNYLSPFICIGIAVFCFMMARRDVKRGYHESVTKYVDSFARTKYTKDSFHFWMWVGGLYATSVFLIICALVFLINWLV